MSMFSCDTTKTYAGISDSCYTAENAYNDTCLKEINDWTIDCMWCMNLSKTDYYAVENTYLNDSCQETWAYM